MVKLNVGRIDGKLRMAGGVVLAALGAFAPLPQAVRIGLVAVGAIAFITGITGL